MKWITRKDVKVDRVACPWLIKKFVDPQAEVLGALAAGSKKRIAAMAVPAPANNINVHRSFPVFIRIAYAWLLVAAALGICAALMNEAPGVWGASRHALTVGFIAAMIFCVGQRVLPSFCGMRILWSTRLMLMMLVLLMAGCTLRVVSELLAYQDYARWAWNVLPVSALIELTAVTLFAINLITTFAHLPMVPPSPLAMTKE